MVAVKTKFDGQTIEVPEQLRGAKAGEVLIVFDERNLGTGGTGKTSIWDFVGKAEKLRTKEDIDEQVRRERESWDR